MSSTNKTTNYELSQFIGTDKPTYLGDYNGDMLKIDTALKTNANNIQAVSSTATTASENANTAITNAQTAQTTAETANTNAGNAQNTATNALNKSLQNESDISKLNLVNFETFLPQNIQTSIGNFNQYSKLNCASNSDGSIGKIYGWLQLNNTNQSNNEGYIRIQTALRPNENISIEGLALRQYVNNGTLSSIVMSNVTISTTGLVTIQFLTSPTISQITLFMPACLLFMKNFGDTSNS